MNDTTHPGLCPADFARMIGKSPAYVTKLRHAGRLVMTADGLIDPAASLTRIMDGSVQAGADDDEPESIFDLAYHDFQAAKARRAHFEALATEQKAVRMASKLLNVVELRQAVDAALLVFDRRARDLVEQATAAVLRSQGQGEAAVCLALSDCVDAFLGRLAGELSTLQGSAHETEKIVR